MKIDLFTDQYLFLSNFAPVKVEFENEIYRSVEHAYQAAKTMDKDARANIRSSRTAARAKSVGRYVKLRPYWSDLRIGIMHGLLVKKFSQEPFRTMLKNTGDAELIEGNNWNDTFWGQCSGKGENNLGKLLMKIRRTLK